jgi:hypothetical protein
VSCGASFKEIAPPLANHHCSNLQGILAFSHYLRVAEDMGAPFWTAGGKLAKKAKSIRADWVHLIHDLDQ